MKRSRVPFRFPHAAGTPRSSVAPLRLTYTYRRHRRGAAVSFPSQPPRRMPVESNPNTPFNEAVSQIFGRHPIYDEIFSCLTPLALVRMASSSRAIRSATEDFARRAYNINKKLKRYFNDPQSFRSLMARTDMVISGSFALQFFDRSFYPESDLDLYAYPNEKLHEIGSHLLKEGYTFKPVGEQIPDLSLEVEYTLLCGPRPHVEENDINMPDVYDDAVNTIKGVLNFERPFEGTDGDARKVQVIVACESPIELILNFHSSKPSARHRRERCLLIVPPSVRHERHHARHCMLAIP